MKQVSLLHELQSKYGRPVSTQSELESGADNAWHEYHRQDCVLSCDNRFWKSHKGDMTERLIAFLMSMLPILELRGGLIYSAANGIPFVQAFLICLAGNLLSIPFILLLLKKVLQLWRSLS